jgi:hypothetical protein
MSVQPNTKYVNFGKRGDTTSRMPTSMLTPLKLPEWSKKLPQSTDRHPKRDGAILRDGIALLATKIPAQALAKKNAKIGAKTKKLTKNSAKDTIQPLHQQPFDSILLQLSPLFRHSRKLYLDQGGNYYPTLLSSPRTLSSPSLLEQIIEYSPIERELIWSATDPVESKSLHLEHLFETRAYSTSLFHETNHRILWTFLPPPPPLGKTGSPVARYLNFVESLVVTLDMALGDELGPELSQVLYLAGVTYDPGTDLRRRPIARRTYRNYLHACLYATYLRLELYEPVDIEKAVTHLYSSALDDPALNSVPSLTKRAMARAERLDEAFVRITNLDWQEKNRSQVVKSLSQKNREPLTLAETALDNRLPYLWAEKWFEKMGL